MNKKDEALRMAIEALEYEEFCSNFLRVEAINACKAALETKEQLFGNSEEFDIEQLIEKHKGERTYFDHELIGAYFTVQNLENLINDVTQSKDVEPILEFNHHYLTPEGTKEVMCISLIDKRVDEVITQGTKLYTRPTKRLSDDAIRDCLYGCKTQNFLQFARAIEKAHGIGND